MRVLFFGTRRQGLEALQRFIDEGYEICSVTTEDYHMDEVTSEDYQRFCTRHKIPFYKTDQIETDEWQKIFADYQADLGVCVGWRRIIGEKILRTTRYGFIGPHGGDLPKYRGFASTHYAILNGDPYCGFCIMKFKPGVADNGVICSRFRIPLNDKTTIKDLHDAARPLVIDHLLTTMKKIKNHTLITQPQDEAKAVYSYPRIPEDGEIDWECSAIEIDRLIRAVTRPYPGAFTYYKNRKLIIWRGHVLKRLFQWVGQPGHVVHIDSHIGVLTGEGILLLEECQFEDENKTISPNQLFKSYRLRLGFNAPKSVKAMEKRIDDLEVQVRDLKNMIQQMNKKESVD